MLQLEDLEQEWAVISGQRSVRRKTGDANWSETSPFRPGRNLRSRAGRDLPDKVGTGRSGLPSKVRVNRVNGQGLDSTNTARE